MTYTPGNIPSNWDPVVFLQELLKVSQSISQMEEKESWHNIGDTGEPSFQNSWANESGYTCGFYRNSDGIVNLRGLCGGGAEGTDIFTLPSGYRPEGGLIILPVAILVDTGTQGVGQIRIGTSGVVQFNDVIGSDDGTTYTYSAPNGWVSLYNIGFRATGF